MIAIETEDFLKDIRGLPKSIADIFAKQKEIFTENWLDVRLHTKRVKEFSGVYSFRITRRYRALFYFAEKTAVFFKIGHRKDIYE